MRRRIPSLLLAVSLELIAGSWSVNGGAAARATVVPAANAAPDFNGDGFADLAVGATLEGVGELEVDAAGVVNVLYGSGSGVSSTGNQLWTQNSPGIDGEAEVSDYYGSALAPGDFDADGFTDLAVGVPGEGVGDAFGAGAVSVLYGSALGLSPVDDQFWSQDNPGILDESEDVDDFGSALAAADFDGDGFADLAVGVRTEEVSGIAYAGAVSVLYGSVSGLAAAGNQFWTQDSPGILEEVDDGAQFGGALVASDFDGDGFADLAIGAQFENLDGETLAGSVNVLYGSGSGLSAAGNQLWTQGSPDVIDEPESGDNFGTALAAGDLNDDGFGDLVVGVPGESLFGRGGVGAANVIYGSISGLSAIGNQVWSQHSTGIRGEAEASDAFGDSLTAADFDGDGISDLAVGVPTESVDLADVRGVVNVLYGTASGLSSQRNQLWSQDSRGILDESEDFDHFGDALAATDFNGDGFADLAVGGLGEDVGNAINAGAVNVVYGSAVGLSSAGNQFWTQDSPGVLDTSEDADSFGAVLTG